MRVVYNKLVRDRIPEIIKADGGHPVTRILDRAGYQAALLAKLLEEAREAGAAPAADLPAELADVLEVLQALVRALGMSWENFLSLAAGKRVERGGFDNRIFLEYAESAG
jgi:predicted house-cleaning noncanonical NTP pyrophosphatase (MazG superfamily)